MLNNCMFDYTGYLFLWRVRSQQLPRGKRTTNRYKRTWGGGAGVLEQNKTKVRLAQLYKKNTKGGLFNTICMYYKLFYLKSVC